MRIGSLDELAQLVRDHRKRLHMSQQTLATRVGVSRQWIIALEQGKPTVEVGLVLGALNALGLNIDVRDRSYVGSPNAAALSDATAQVIARARAGGPVHRLPTTTPRRP